MKIPHSHNPSFRSRKSFSKKAESKSESQNQPPSRLELDYRKWREQDGALIRWTSNAADLAFKLLPSVEAGITTASAGAARGVAYGAGLEEFQEKLMMGANLAAVGVAMVSLPTSSIPMALTLRGAMSLLGKAVPSAVAQVGQGFKKWESLPDSCKDRVHSSTEQAMDQIFSDLRPRSRRERALRGLTGEIVGLAAGGRVGLQYGFQNSQNRGHKIVDYVQRQLYKNMHQSPSWQQTL